MRVVSRNHMPMALSATYRCHRWLAVVAAVVLAGCGGQNGLHTSSKNSTAGGAAAAGASAGGDGWDGGGATAGGGSALGGGGTSGGGAGASGAGGAGVATGGVTSQGGSPGAGQDGGAIDGEIPASPDAPCDFLFWIAVTQAMAIDGLCMPTPDGQTSWGEIILDSEGMVIGITRFGTSNQALLDKLANGRWPCLAGQAFQYFCDVGG